MRRLDYKPPLDGLDRRFKAWALLGGVPHDFYLVWMRRSCGEKEGVDIKRGGGLSS